jgi:hypothetical protein
MTWNKVLKTAKKYWQYVALFFVGIFGFIIFRKKDIPNDDQKSSRDSKNNQLDQIDAIRKDERDQQDAVDKTLEDGLKVVEQQYEQQKKELTQKKKEEIKNVLEMHKNDPVGLAKKLSEVTGFKIIMAEE